MNCGQKGINRAKVPMHMASNTALCSKRNSAFVREEHFLPIPSCALSIHFTVPKLEDARVMHDLSPIAASILCGQLLGMALGNPSASLRDGCPPINSQLIGCFPQCAHDACGRPIHSAIRVNSIDHHVAEDIRLDELCHQMPPSLLHIFSPLAFLKRRVMRLEASTKASTAPSIVKSS